MLFDQKNTEYHKLRSTRDAGWAKKNRTFCKNQFFLIKNQIFSHQNIISRGKKR